MKRVILYTILSLFFLINACSQQGVFDKGEIYTSVALKNDTAVSYALYIPQSESKNQALAIVFFDPHGSGSLPVGLYKNLSEEFGITLIGCNFSSNNSDINLIHADLQMLLQELNSKFQLEQKNMMFWGFSGGAKVAMYNAGFENGVNYCIYGGSVMNTQAKDIHLLGFNGKNDMNYTDLKSYDFSQQKNPDHFQIEFDGKHAWPDTLTARNGFEWFLLQKMQHKELPLNSEIISGVSTRNKLLVNNLIINKSLLDAYEICARSIYFLNGLTDIQYYIKQQLAIKKNPLFTAQIKSLQDNFKLESQLKSQYQPALFVKDTMYWKNEIESLWKKSASDNTGIYNRLLGFLSLAGYSYANHAFRSGDIKTLHQILFIYHHADPTNPEQAFMRAKLYLMEHENDNAKQALDEAIQLGLDMNRINIEFQPLNSDLK